MRAVALLPVLAGCFGAGDLPTTPALATTLFAATAPSAGQDCNGAKYIGDVAFGATRGFVFELPYFPPDCNNNGGGGGSTSQVVVTSFDLTGNDLSTTSFGDAGNVGTGMGGPRIAASGDTPTWLFQSQMGLAVTVGVSPTPIPVETMMGEGPAGIVIGADGTTLVAARQMTTSFEDPQYPCCGSTPASSPSFVATIPPAGVASTRLDLMLALACDTLDSCLVANTTSVFVMEHTPSGAQVRTFPKTATTPVEVTPIDQITTAVFRHAIPVGMAADDTGVVFAISQDPNQPGDGPGCEIRRYDFQTAAVTTLLLTTSFWCQDVAIDNAAAYFAITDFIVDGNIRMRGLGIGRVGFDRTVATTRLGMIGATAGPRRVHVDGGFLYAIDPFVIGRIATQDLVGREDIAP